MPPPSGKPTFTDAVQPEPESQADGQLTSDPDALVGVDKAGVIRFVNRQTETMFGHDRESLIGQPVETLVPEAFWLSHPPQRQEYAQDPETRTLGNRLELTGRHSDGMAIPVEITLAEVDTADGPLVIASIHDLSDQPEVEGSRALLGRLAAIVAHSDDAIIGKTLDGIITSWNHGAQRMHGYSSKEIIGTPITRLIPGNRTGENEAILGMIRAGQPFKNFETIRIRKDGTTFPASLTISPIRDAGGAVIGASIIARDMTKQKEAFAATQRMAAIVKHSDDAIIGGTLDGRITSWNPAAERMFRYLSHEILGKSSDLLSPADRLYEIRSVMTRIRAGRHVDRLETIRVRRDGTLFPASLTISPIRDEEGAVVGASTIARDVTEAKLAQLEIAEQRAEALLRLAELDTANANLLSVNKAMQGFIDIAAHDLSTPLSSVVGFSDLLAEGWTTISEDSRQNFAGIINRQAHNLAGLVNDLLTLSNIEGGTSGARPQHVVLSKVISGCLERCAMSTAEVSVTCPSDLVVWTDPIHLARIVDNYLTNALKHGGPPVRIEAARRDATIELQVLDHGSGVPEEFLPRLFDKFAQADSWGTRGRGGAGLGLSIVRSLARVNGGQALYEPNVSGGSCFIVRLPAEAPD